MEHTRHTKKKYMKKKYCDSKSGSANGWDKEGRKVFTKLCKNIQTLRENPKTGKNLEKMMLERFKSEKTLLYQKMVALLPVVLLKRKMRMTTILILHGCNCLTKWRKFRPCFQNRYCSFCQSIH